MARVTVEDCVDKVPNRFDLVMLAAHRAREVSAGSQITVPRDNDKNPVVALREIAEETQQSDDLRERMIEANQTQIEIPFDMVLAWDRSARVRKMTLHTKVAASAKRARKATGK